VSAKHTPGPWCLHPNALSHKAKAYVQDAASEHIATVIAPYDNDEGLRACVANARLIAAAPDLLEALREAREVLFAEYQRDGTFGRELWLADEAIAKAVQS
jgi:hypothetical protein